MAKWAKPLAVEAVNVKLPRALKRLLTDYQTEDCLHKWNAKQATGRTFGS
jgi:hypothetical protein